MWIACKSCWPSGFNGLIWDQVRHVSWAMFVQFDSFNSKCEELCGFNRYWRYFTSIETRITNEATLKVPGWTSGRFLGTFLGGRGNFLDLAFCTVGFKGLCQKRVQKPPKSVCSEMPKMLMNHTWDPNLQTALKAMGARALQTYSYRLSCIWICTYIYSTYYIVLYIYICIKHHCRAALGEQCCPMQQKTPSWTLNARRFEGRCKCSFLKKGTTTNFFRCFFWLIQLNPQHDANQRPLWHLSWLCLSDLSAIPGRGTNLRKLLDALPKHFVAAKSLPPRDSPVCKKNQELRRCWWLTQIGQIMSIMSK